MKRGHQTRLAAPPGPDGFYHVVGAYNWRTDCVSHQIIEHKNSEAFIHFLDYVMMQVYPDAEVVLVMDNAPYHRSRMVAAALSLFEHCLRVFWLPPYCPVLNMIERFWRHLKDLATANCLFKTTLALLHSLECILAAQNISGHPLRLTFSKSL